MSQISENLALDICIYNDMPFATWLRLRQLCKSYHHIFTTKIFPKWCSYTRDRIDSHIKSLKIFENSHSLTGGFLLDCIFDTNYSSDIDLLVINKTTFEPIDSEFIKSRRHKSDFLKVTNEIYEMGYRTNTTAKNPRSKEFNVRKFSCSNLKNIDHIILHTFQNHQEFVDQFDFSFCKINFDGKKLYINDIESIINKSTVFDKKAIENSLKMAAYEIRSDYPIRSLPYVQKIDHVFEKFLERQDKYRKRNFDVKTEVLLYQQITEIAEVMDQ